MLERIEIKKLVKQAVSRDPPLNWYLYHRCIYGRFISKLTDYVSSFCFRTARSYETLINNIISKRLNRTVNCNINLFPKFIML